MQDCFHEIITIDPVANRGRIIALLSETGAPADEIAEVIDCGDFEFGECIRCGETAVRITMLGQMRQEAEDRRN